MSLVWNSGRKFSRGGKQQGTTNTLSRQRGGREVQGDRETAVAGRIEPVDPGPGAMNSGATYIDEFNWTSDTDYRGPSPVPGKPRQQGRR